MVEIILLSILLAINLSFIFFFLFSVYPQIKNTKLRALQNNLGMKLIHKAIQEQKAILQSIEDNKMVFSNGKPKEEIEHQYDRAKKILQNGIMEEKDILQYCDITLEEMELLSGLIKNTEIKN
ncbi:hypothetical protein EP47_04965 [Legionella norrlandica]|uniref:DUF2802 domain-containing protein n=1 Tax=Legionella norrlandica TaxID=1498499 RepID=A0A0A2SSI8_9GAMM|nr:hypothetical protein [Legionella norrlandica]KGP63717.1 hypothetical protein EP47_04965 [Legionella norrlandica]